jgi:hypothetical protein
MGRAYSKHGRYKYIQNFTEGEKPLERPRRRWEDNIKMDLK